MDMNYENWEQNAPLPGMEAELRKIRRELRRRSRKTILISLILAAAILIGTVSYGIPTLENLYWNPNTVSFGTPHATDLLMTFYAYGQLFCPTRVINDVTATRTGFASYSIVMDTYSFSKNERDYGYATLEKGELTIQEGFWDEINQVAVGNTLPETEEHIVELLSQLPEYVRVGCYVTFREDITMQDALDFNRALIQDVLETVNYTQLQWLAVRHQEKAYARPCGLTLSGIYGLFDEVNDSYPCFSGADMGADSDATSAEHHEEHFKSLLRYLDDQQKKGEGIEVPHYPGYYADALSYVEENGVKIYGCYITASPQRLLEISKMENVQYLWPDEAWINI